MAPGRCEHKNFTVTPDAGPCPVCAVIAQLPSAWLRYADARGETVAHVLDIQRPQRGEFMGGHGGDVDFVYATEVYAQQVEGARERAHKAEASLFALLDRLRP